jgi:hypothetical protein
MDKLEEAIARLERAVARLEGSAARHLDVGASGERETENSRLRAVAGDIATRADAAIARIDRILGGDR